MTACHLRHSSSLLFEVALATILSIPACPTRAGTPRFSPVTDAVGLQHDYWAPGTYGPGVAAADFDDDGDLDIFVSNDATGCRLFMNLGDGTFQNVAPALGLDHMAVLPPPEDRTNPTDIDPTSMMPSFLDTDNDGDKDLFLTCWNTYCRLYENNGDGTFTDVSFESGLAIVGHTATAAFGDFDRNSRLDVYLVDWGGQDHLFVNRGHNVFKDVSDQMGIHDLPMPGMPGWCAIWFYYNDDLYPDLYVGNDFGIPNLLFVNAGGVALLESAMDAFPELSDGSWAGNATMGQALGDYDHDGDYDLFVANSLLNDLYRREGSQYINVMRDPTYVGPGRPLNNLKDNNIGWFCDWPDLDNDGYVDLFLVNGYILLCPSGDPQDPGCMQVGDIEQPNRLWMNDGDGSFTDVTDASGLTEDSWGRAAAVADFDSDGRLDIYLVNSGSGPRPGQHVFYRNETSETGSWLTVRLVGVTSNRDGIGAQLRARVGSYSHMRDKFATTGYLSQPSDEVYFGLGTATVVEELTIYWPSGTVDVFHDVEANQRITIVEGSSHEVAILSALGGIEASADGNAVELRWEVEPTLPWKEFRVQRTADGEWTGTLDTVTAVEGRTAYSYSDRQARVGRGYRYRVAGRYGDVEVQTAEVAVRILETNSLLGLQAAPNPLNPNTTLRYHVPAGTPISLQIVDVRGRVIARIFAESAAGWHEVIWNGTDDTGIRVASGTYRAVLSAGPRQTSAPLTVVK